jgi:hypothetical protein
MENEGKEPILPPWLSKMLRWTWTGFKWLLFLGCMGGLILLLILAGQTKTKPVPPKVNAIVTLYDGGKEVGQWTTEDGVGYFDSAPNTLWFTDKATGSKVRVHGTFTVVVPKKGVK